MAKLAVIGSINMDIVNMVLHHPKPGETIHGLETVYTPGGKGANQAVAAAKHGAHVTMIGAVGDDLFANPLLLALSQAGVQTESVLRKDGASGLAFITVSQSGENTIILSAGANGELQVKDLDACSAILNDVQAILLQNEIPWEMTVRAIRTGQELGKRVYLNPAPARQVSDGILSQLSMLIVNETEAYSLTGIEITSVENAFTAAGQLLNRGVPEVLITMGIHGSLYVNSSGERLHTKAYQVEAVDTTAAGDTFIGVFAACRESGMLIQESLMRASAAAAVTVTREGAQASIPTINEVDDWLNHR
jgi:ribokinase